MFSAASGLEIDIDVDGRAFIRRGPGLRRVRILEGEILYVLPLTGRLGLGSGLLADRRSLFMFFVIKKIYC